MDKIEVTQEYRKTATIRATQWWKDGDHPAVIRKSGRHRYADEGIPWIETLEGGHIVTPGDWIATGIQGEHWAIKPDVFAATYEPVTATRTDATPVAWQRRRMWDSPSDPAGKVHLWHECRKEEATGHFDKTPGYEYRALYTHPPATDVAALVEAAKASAEGWANAVEFNLLPMQHWQTANELQRQLRQALAPFTKGQNDE